MDVKNNVCVISKVACINRIFQKRWDRIFLVMGKEDEGDEVKKRR